MDYLNFDLLFERNNRKYKAWVINSPGGQATLKFELPFSESEMRNFISKIGAAFLEDNDSGHPPLEIVKQFGTALFETVFDKSIWGCMRSSLDEAENQAKGLRLRLRLTDTPELVNLPWEYLYNSNLNRFFSLSVETPIVRYLDIPERVRKPIINPPLKILVMISCPYDYPPIDADHEWKNLEKALYNLKNKNLATVSRLEGATITHLNRYLQKEKYHVFHYIGHGNFDEGAQKGALVLENDDGGGRLISAELIGTILKDHKTLCLAFLNTCEGARTSVNDPFAGTAQHLVQQGIPAVIAIPHKISDAAAITLSQEFYSAISQDLPVDTALAATRKAMYVGGHPIAWGAPVLYMRSPDGRIFQFNDQGGEQSLETEDSGSMQTSIGAVIDPSVDEQKQNIKKITEVGSDKSTDRSKENERIRKFRLSVSAIFFATAFAIVLLQRIRVASTAVELELAASEFSFVLAENWDVFSLEANGLRISTLDDILLEVLSVEQAIEFDPETDRPISWQKIDSSERFSVNKNDSNWRMTIESDYLNLTNLQFEAGSRIHIVKDNQTRNQISLRTSKGTVRGSINTGDTLIITCSSCQFDHDLFKDIAVTKALRIASFDNQISFKDYSNSIWIELELRSQQSDKTPMMFDEFIQIKSINFTKFVNNKVRSTVVQDGAIYLKEVNNKKVETHDGDFVFLNELRGFQIKKLRLSDSILLSLNGTVGKLNAGPEAAIQNRIPSLLEWLYANQVTTLGIATIVPVFLTILAILYRLRIIKDV